MFETVCFSLKDLPDTKPSVGYADFEFLRDHPYFEHNGELYCLDYEYAVGKLESGALWRVLRALDEKQREPYLSFLGNVFEDYVAWLFEIYANATLNKVYPSPMYPNEKNKPICDLVVICGSTAILIEAKLATCRTDIRYAGDYKTMKKYLEDKLVVGTNRPVGVAQLLTAIRNLSALPQSSIPTWLQGIKKLMPVILTKDEIGSSWAVNSYLNMRSRQAWSVISTRGEPILRSMITCSFPCGGARYFYTTPKPLSTTWSRRSVYRVGPGFRAPRFTHFVTHSQ
jgi:hypothetical protein